MPRGLSSSLVTSRQRSASTPVAQHVELQAILRIECGKRDVGIDARAAIERGEAIGIGVHRGEGFGPDRLHRAGAVEQDVGMDRGGAGRLGGGGRGERGRESKRQKQGKSGAGGFIVRVSGSGGGRTLVLAMRLEGVRRCRRLAVWAAGRKRGDKIDRGLVALLEEGKRCAGRRKGDAADAEGGEGETDGGLHGCPLLSRRPAPVSRWSGCRRRLRPLSGVNWGETAISRVLFESAGLLQPASALVPPACRGRTPASRKPTRIRAEARANAATPSRPTRSPALWGQGHWAGPRPSSDSRPGARRLWLSTSACAR